MPRFLVINGPNLNLLGHRDRGIYDSMTLSEIEGLMTGEAEALGVELDFFQSNSEGSLIDHLQEEGPSSQGVIINPGAFTHYAWAIHDALAAFDGPVVEVHLSNPAAREPWRHTSVVAPVAAGTIAGFGSDGYRLAVDAVASLLDR